MVAGTGIRCQERTPAPGAAQRSDDGHPDPATRRCGTAPSPASIYVLANARGPKRRAAVSRRLGLDDFRGHDLRRTAASRMASAGVPRLVIGKVLNHAERGGDGRLRPAHIRLGEARSARLVGATPSGDRHQVLVVADVEITHPYHPLHGQAFPFYSCVTTGGCAWCAACGMIKPCCPCRLRGPATDTKTPSSGRPRGVRCCGRTTSARSARSSTRCWNGAEVVVRNKCAVFSEIRAA